MANLGWSTNTDWTAAQSTTNIDINSGTFELADAIPDSEDFEHNDLTGVYVGDTGDYTIQTNTVIEGGYSLQRTGAGSWAAIVRDSAKKFSFDGIRIDFRQIPQNNDGGAGGGVGVATSKSGYSSGNFYSGYIQANNNNIRLYRHDSGSDTEIANRVSKTLSYGTEYSGYFEISGDTITYSVEGTTISATDSNYNEGYLAFVGFADYVIDGIVFEKT